MAEAPAPAVQSSGPQGPAASVIDRPKLFAADDLLQVEVVADDLSLTDDFGVYASRAGLYVPLGELSRLLDFPIAVDPGRGRAEGSVLSKTRTFVLDLDAHQARVADRSVQIADAQALQFEGDIYIRQDLLEQLLPLKLKPDLHQLRLVLVPTEKLPFQERAAREKRRAGLGRGEAEEPVMKVAAPYALFTPPSIDVTVGAEVDSHQEGTRQYQVALAGDVAFFSARAFAGSDSQGRLDNVRLLMDRHDEDGKALGALGLTDLSAGDTYTPFLAVGARSAGGRGLAFTSAPLQRASVFEKIDLRGDLPAGYEVELYINEVLHGSIGQSSDGRYDFQDVGLTYGLNTVRLVFYGPRGERREEVQRINVGSGALAKGQFVYSFGAVQQNTPLIPVGGRETAFPNAPGYRDPRVVGSVGYGLTDTTTLSAAFARYTPTASGQRNMGSLGFSTSFMGMALQAEGAGDDRGGAALVFGAAGRPGGVSTVFRHAEYEGGFFDETVAGGGPGLIRDSSLNLDFNAPLKFGPWPMSARATWDQYRDGSERLSSIFRLSKPIGSYLVSNTLDYEGFSGGGLNGQSLINETDVSVLVRRTWQVRGGMTFDAAPAAKLDSLFLTIQRDIAQRAAVSFGVTKAFGPGEGASFQGSTIFRLKAMDLTFGAGYDTQRRNAFFGIQISTGLLFDPFVHAYRAVGPGAATSGSAAFRSFVDANGDGRWQPGEAAVPGITTQSGRQPGTSDAQGDLIVSSLGDGAKTRLYFDTSKVDDPYLSGPPAVVELTPRAGRVIPVPYPMIAASEVQVEVLFARAGEKPRGLSALNVQLVSAAGEVVAQGRTAYDGTVIIEGLKPGVYTLRIDPEQAQRLHMALKAPVTIKAGPGGGFIGKVSADAVLDPAAQSQPVVPSSSGGA